ncbi:MAG: type II toxin-antitoxin system RelE/ParE family toxin [Candidatus Micrarchaeota archaeon]
MLQFDSSDLLRLKMRKLADKDRPLLEIVKKKMKEVVNNDAKTAAVRYKNLRADLKGLKRVHIDRNFVLIFRVDEEREFVFFVDFDHHDRIYK